jgi:hypothetical protein
MCTKPSMPLDVHESAKVNNAGYHAFYDIADLKFGQARGHVVADGFFFGENQFVVFAADIQNADPQVFIDQAVELGQDLVLVAVGYARVMLGGQLETGKKPRMPSSSISKPPRLASYGLTSTISWSSNTRCSSPQPRSLTARFMDSSA